MIHRNWSVTGLLQAVSSSQASDQQSTTSMQSIAESPGPRNRSNTFSNDSDSASLQSNTLPRRKKLNGLMHRSTSGFHALIRGLLPENSADASEAGKGAPDDHLYPPSELVHDRPRRKSDSADELLRDPSRPRKPRGIVQPASYEPHTLRSGSDVPPNSYTRQIPGPRSEAELRYRNGGADRPPPPPQVRLPSHTREASRKQSSSTLQMLTPDCCNAAGVKTPTFGPVDAGRDSFFGDEGRGKQRIHDIQAMLDGYQPSVQGGLGLALTRELLYQQSRNNARSQSHYTPLGRDSSTVQRTLSSKEAHPRTHKSLSSRADLTKLPPLPSPPAHATPYQFSLAGNSTLSLNRDVITPSSTPSGWVETYHELGLSKGSAGLAGVPDEARSLLQRRSRKPLEIGLFQGSDKQDSANGQTAAVSTGWQSQGSTSMSAMVTSPKSPGSLRSPPPFPPPRMPLPAVPKSGSTHIPMPHTPMPTLLQPDTAGSSKTFYGKHSPLIGSAKLAATEVEGRSRSSSLDTPSAALYRRQGQASGRGRFDSGSACTFTPLTALPAPIRPPRAQGNVAYREHAPQVELAFLAKSSAAPFNATGSELGSLGKLRNDLNDYGRVSLENSSPRPSSPSYTSQPTYSGSEDAATYGDDAMRAQEARNLTRRRQLSSPPLVLHAEANNPALTRSDSSRGRRSSISMLPYKNEPSWSLDHSSPPQAQRELQQSERSALGHAPSSSLRHMAAFVAASTPASRPGPGRGHAANSSAGSMSSRDTSPLIPMVHTSSHAGSSASSASFDGPPTPADSIMERFSTVDHPPSATRQSMSVPRILLLGTQEIPAEYEHLLRDRADTIANETDVLNRPPMGSTLSQLPDTGLRGHSPQKLSPILASGPGSFETHSSGPKLISPSARTSEIIHSADFPFVGHIERRTPEQFSAATPSARTSRITSYAASLGHGQPHMTTDSTSPNTHAYTDNLHRSPSGRSWKPSLPASRKASTNSRGMTGSYRRDDEIDQTSIYGMAM